MLQRVSSSGKTTSVTGVSAGATDLPSKDSIYGKIKVQQLPAKIEDLLCHDKKLTPILVEKYGPIKIDNKTNNIKTPEMIYTRTSVLRNNPSNVIRSFGEIEIPLKPFEKYPQFVPDLLRAEQPFGGLLQKHGIAVVGEPDAFYIIQDPEDKKIIFQDLAAKKRVIRGQKTEFEFDDDIAKAFALDSKTQIFGRHNVLKLVDPATGEPTDIVVAKVNEFLAV